MSCTRQLPRTEQPTNHHSGPVGPRGRTGLSTGSLPSGHSPAHPPCGAELVGHLTPGLAGKALLGLGARARQTWDETDDKSVCKTYILYLKSLLFYFTVLKRKPGPQACRGKSLSPPKPNPKSFIPCGSVCSGIGSK